MCSSSPSAWLFFAPNGWAVHWVLLPSSWLGHSFRPDLCPLRPFPNNWHTTTGTGTQGHKSTCFRGLFLSTWDQEGQPIINKPSLSSPNACKTTLAHARITSCTWAKATLPTFIYQSLCMTHAFPFRGGLGWNTRRALAGSSPTRMDAHKNPHLCFKNSASSWLRPRARENIVSDSGNVPAKNPTDSAATGVHPLISAENTTHPATSESQPYYAVVAHD